jgi:hypothetical protein
MNDPVAEELFGLAIERGFPHCVLLNKAAERLNALVTRFDVTEAAYRELVVQRDTLAASLDRLTSDKARLAAELAALSEKACTAVLVYRAALVQLTNGYKYSTEVCTIAREALAHSTEFTKEKDSQP